MDSLSDLRRRADSLVATLMAAINAGDAAVVAGMAARHGETHDTTGGRAIIDDFRHHFGGAHIARVKFLRAHDGAGGRPRPSFAHIEYDLVATNGRAKMVAVYYDARPGGGFWAYDEFLSYSARVHYFVPAVVEAIRSRDAARLARLLSPDDIEYPDSLAVRAITRYAERFDLETVGYRFDRLSASRDSAARDRLTLPYVSVDRPFHYSLVGTKNGEPVEHAVTIRHGDGLLGWRDTLMPEYGGQLTTGRQEQHGTSGMCLGLVLDHLTYRGLRLSFKATAELAAIATM